VLAEHRRLLRDAFKAHQGVEVDTQGDAFFVAFPTAPGALGAAAEATEGLAPGPFRVRMGIHTGTPHVTDEGTSVSTSTARRGSRPPATAARCSYLPPRQRSWARTSCATWASTG
jgi:class 3 adenylate cyclase